MGSSKFAVVTFISAMPLFACGGHTVTDHGSASGGIGGDAGGAESSSTGGATSTLGAGTGGAGAPVGSGGATLASSGGAGNDGTGGAGGYLASGGASTATGGASTATGGAGAGTGGAPPTFTVSIQRLGCFGDCADIEAVPTIYDDTAQYTYSWEDGSTTRVRHVCPTPATTYEVSVTELSFEFTPGQPPPSPATAKATLPGSAVGCADLDGGVTAAEQDAATPASMTVGITGSPMSGFYSFENGGGNVGGPFDFSASSVQGSVDIVETGLVLSPTTTATTPRVKITLTFGTYDDGVYPANGVGTCSMSTTSTVWPTGRTDFECKGLVGIVTGQPFSLSGSVFLSP